jgi:hypothetical protein
MAFGEGSIRFVTHLNLTKEDIDATCEILRKINI